MKLAYVRARNTRIVHIAAVVDDLVNTNALCGLHQLLWAEATTEIPVGCQLCQSCRHSRTVQANGLPKPEQPRLGNMR